MEWNGARYLPVEGGGAASNARSLRSKEIVSRFEALLFESALKPIAESLGFYGEIVTGALAQGLSRRGDAGLESVLERSLARNDR